MFKSFGIAKIMVEYLILVVRQHLRTAIFDSISSLKNRNVSLISCPNPSKYKVCSLKKRLIITMRIDQLIANDESRGCH